jgi:hypothetical protein
MEIEFPEPHVEPAGLYDDVLRLADLGDAGFHWVKGLKLLLL